MIELDFLALRFCFSGYRVKYLQGHPQVEKWDMVNTHFFILKLSFKLYSCNIHVNLQVKRNSLYVTDFSHESYFVFILSLTH